MNQYDVAVIGAGSAGLQAALTLGRMRRPVVVFGTDHYRNDPTAEMHNFLGHDGTPPAELRTAARADLSSYDTVEVVERAVTRISGEPDAFVVEVDGAEPVSARRVLLATGVADTLPDIPGVADLFGGVIAHCPYCHGYEYADRPVAILSSDPHAARVAGLIQRIASTITVLTNGGTLDDDTTATLQRMGVEVRSERVLKVRGNDAGLTVDLDGDLDDGRTDGHDGLDFGGMFVASAWAQAAPFAEQLGLEMSAMGAIVVDAFGRTSRPGVSAAGDLAQPPGVPMPMASVLNAAAQGLTAATGLDMELMHLDNGLAMPQL